MELQQHPVLAVNFSRPSDVVSNGGHFENKKSAENLDMINDDDGDVIDILKDEEVQRPTTYLESLMHLFKGNVGPGCFAMAEAIKNGGLILGPIMVLLLGIICGHVQHILVNCSSQMKAKFKLTTKPGYAETVELCVMSNKRWQHLAPAMRRACNVIICVTQLSFGCIYFVFVGENLKQVLDFYGFEMNIHVLVTLILIPVWMTSLITNLKYLAPCSGIANACMLTGMMTTYYYSAQDLPAFSERNYLPASISTLPLFFGTTIFAFEGIALVLPLQNSMKNPKNFSKTFGVLNVGIVLVTGLYVSFGAIGYWKYGEAAAGSLTLNLPTDKILAQSVKLAIALGVLLGYAIQFFIPIQIMYPSVRSSIKLADRHPFIGELIFRTIMVLITFAITELVPNLNLLLSLVGAVLSTTIAVTLPPLMQFMILSSEETGISWFVLIKNSLILLIAICGFLTGGYVSLSELIETFFD